MMVTEEVLDIHQILAREDYTPQKWELIERLLTFCEPSICSISDDVVYREAISLAGSIEDALKQLYDLNVTPEWKKEYLEAQPGLLELVEEQDYEKLLDFVEGIHGNIQFCIACKAAVDEMDTHAGTPMCDLCTFGKDHGICGSTSGSLYGRFESHFNLARGG